jgi:hypothetical protein
MTQTRAQIHQDHEGSLGLPFAYFIFPFVKRPL